MTNAWKIATVLALVLGLVGSVSLFLHGSSSGALGSTGQPSTVSPNPEWFSGGQTVGLTGTFNQNTQFGSCSLIGTSAGITATTTANFDCAVSGIKAGDLVLEDPSPLEGVGIASDIFPIAAKASTTSGFITFTLINLSGAASTTLGANIASSTEYFTLR